MAVNEIIIARGKALGFNVILDAKYRSGKKYLFSASDYARLSVRDGSGKEIFKKKFLIIDTAPDEPRAPKGPYIFTLYITEEESQRLAPGSYVWDFTIYTDAVIDRWGLPVDGNYVNIPFSDPAVFTVLNDGSENPRADITVSVIMAKNTDYDSLTNKPAIDGTVLTKTSTAAELGLASADAVGDVDDLEYPSPTLADGINHNYNLIGGELEYLELTADNLIDEANKLLHQIGAIFDIPYGSLTDAVLAIDAHDQEQDAKLQTLNGHYYPLDGYDFGKTLDVKTPDPSDVALLTTYAMTMEGVSDPSDIIRDTVIKNEYDGVEFVWNAETLAWLDWGIGNIVTASNEHLGVVKGTPVPADPVEASNSKDITVLPDGSMRLIGESGKVDSVDGVTPGLDKNIELTVEMTRAEHDALEDPPGSGLYPSLAGKTVTLPDVYPSGCPFPVGAIHLSVDSRNPSELWAGTTWSAWGSGRVPVGFDSTQTEFDTVEKTDGEKVHTLSTSEMPSHNHSGNTIGAGQAAPGIAAATIGQGFANTGYAGGNGAHNNLQPYIVCYMWKREA